MEHICGKGILQLVDVDVGVAALPGGKDLEIWPVVLGKEGSVFFLEDTKLCGPGGIWLECGGYVGADILLDVHVLAEGTLLDVCHIVLEQVVDAVLQLDDGGGIRSHQDSDVPFQAHADNTVVAGPVVRDGVHIIMFGIDGLDELGQISTDNAGYRAAEGSIRCIVLDYLAHNGGACVVKYVGTIFEGGIQPYL